ncbi:MAG: SPOR domain-containing protein [Pseudomonadota bacterium]
MSDRSVSLIERDVEAPDVFQVTDKGLWDGRPSLGGVWVAHPEVDKPERVIIRNTENSEFVIGALFRRERDNPGPVLMVSSDAAAELGMLAGAPAQLNVTALRREEISDPQAEAEAAEAAEMAAQSEAAAAETEATLAALPLGAAAGVAISDAAPEADPVASAAAAITAVEAEAAGETINASGTVEGAVAAPAIESEVALQTAPGIDVADRDKKYLQVGIFSQQHHAERTASVMTAAGLSPIIRSETTQGATFWRVVVGPSESVFERTSQLEVIRGEGFVETFPVLD